jgi:hypothetical protein
MKEDLGLYGNELNYFTTFFKWVRQHTHISIYWACIVSVTWSCCIHPASSYPISDLPNGYRPVKCADSSSHAASPADNSVANLGNPHMLSVHRHDSPTSVWTSFSHRLLRRYGLARLLYHHQVLNHKCIVWTVLIVTANGTCPTKLPSAWVSTVSLHQPEPCSLEPCKVHFRQTSKGCMVDRDGGGLLLSMWVSTLPTVSYIDQARVFVQPPLL